MNFLPERKFKTKAICGLNKRELFDKLNYSIHNYRLKSAIEATTYIHHSGYNQEWWDNIFNIILKNNHVKLYGHYQQIKEYYDIYINEKQNNFSMNSTQNTCWHMCVITTLVTIIDKIPILTRQQIKSLPFLQFILREGSQRPHKLRIIHENMVNCIEDASTTQDIEELLQLIHYVLREDYGHNKYVPMLIENLVEKSSFENLFSKTPPPALDYLLKADNVMLSPHVAGWTVESHQKLAQTILDKIVNYFH